MVDDEFVTRYTPGTETWKVVTAKGLRFAVKSISERIGFPPEQFSSKSLRSGFATHMASCGIMREDMLYRGVCSVMSRVPETRYINSFSRGAYGAAYDPNGVVAGLAVAGAWKMSAPGPVLSHQGMTQCLVGVGGKHWNLVGGVTSSHCGRTCTRCGRWTCGLATSRWVCRHLFVGDRASVRRSRSWRDSWWVTV